MDMYAGPSIPVAMRTDVHTHMGIYLYEGCIDRHSYGVGISLALRHGSATVCKDMRIAMCTDMCTGTCTQICIDMAAPLSA